MRFPAVLFSILAAVPASAQVPPAPPPPLPLDPISIRLLVAHNQERIRVGVPPLTWDPALAASAASYGPALAANGRLQDSPRASRPG